MGSDRPSDGRNARRYETIGRRVGGWVVGGAGGRDRCARGSVASGRAGPLGGVGRRVGSCSFGEAEESRAEQRPGQTTPHRARPDRTRPGQITPGQTTPGQARPHQTRHYPYFSVSSLLPDSAASEHRGLYRHARQHLGLRHHFVLFPAKSRMPRGILAVRFGPEADHRARLGRASDVTACEGVA